MKKLIAWFSMVGYIALLFGGMTLVNHMNNLAKSYYSMTDIIISNTIVLLLAALTGSIIYLYNKFIFSKLFQLATLFLSLFIVVLAIFVPVFFYDELIILVAVIFGNAVVKLINELKKK